jgi:hypothetical protein
MREEEMTTHAIQAYCEGYEAYLRIIRQNPRRVLAMDHPETQSPYHEGAELRRVWLEGWRDAVNESYLPTETHS